MMHGCKGVGYPEGSEQDDEGRGEESPRMHSSSISDQVRPGPGAFDLVLEYGESHLEAAW